MAAAPQLNLDLVDLRHLQVEDLEPLLEEEIDAWENRLDWDFRASADLVRRFVRMQSLHGSALMDGGDVVGYCYYVLEDRKGLIGDLYVKAEYRTAGSEEQLLRAAIGGLRTLQHVKRIEAQLMMLSESPHNIKAKHSFPRQFMMAVAKDALTLPDPRPSQTIIQPWSEQSQEAAARLIATAYYDHVDGMINDQYQTISGARRFLTNIVQYPGCGSFFQPGSFVASDSYTGEMLGISLASLVAFDSGHITQICVDPGARSQAIGYALLRESMQALARHGCRGVSLTVTSENKEALRLYQRTGFSTQHRFDALVWD
jgi:ribosomal protein S18 acetylase RimI-like enzyme